METGKLMKQVAIYCRYATTSADAAFNQELHLLDTVEKHSDWNLYGKYYDCGVSGNRARRIALQQFLNDAKTSKFDILLVESPSRFYRNTEKTIKTIKQIQNLGVRVVFCDGSDADAVIRFYEAFA